MGDIEAGKSKPAVDTVVSIYRNFDCSLEWLLTGTTDKQIFDGQKKMVLSNSELTLFENELVSSFRKLNMDNQIEILEIINLKLRK